MSDDITDRRPLFGLVGVLLAVVVFFVLGGALIAWLRHRDAERRRWENTVRDRQLAREMTGAALEGDLTTVRRLLDEGVPVDVRDTDGTTSLHNAAANNHLEIVELLIKRGAAVNAQDVFGRSVLRYNMIGMKVETVRLLLENGADPSLADKQGRTPIDDAEACGFKEIVALLKANLPSAEAVR